MEYENSVPTPCSETSSSDFNKFANAKMVQVNLFLAIHSHTFTCKIIPASLKSQTRMFLNRHYSGKEMSKLFSSSESPSSARARWWLYILQQIWYFTRTRNCICNWIGIRRNGPSHLFIEIVCSTDMILIWYVSVFIALLQ